VEFVMTGKLRRREGVQPLRLKPYLRQSFEIDPEDLLGLAGN
jgi:hypothetical protein